MTSDDGNNSGSDIFRAVINQMGNVIQLSVLRYINTGDRIYDTAIGVFINTLIAWVSMKFIRLCSSTGMGETWNRYRRWFAGATGNSPTTLRKSTDIDFATFIPKPLSEYKFSTGFASSSSTAIFYRWIIRTYGVKIPLKLAISTTAYNTKNGLVYSDSRDNDDSFVQNNLRCFDNVPVWISADGTTYVVVGCSNHTFLAYCDDQDLLRQCLAFAWKENTAIEELKNGLTATSTLRPRRLWQQHPFKYIGDINPRRTFETLFYEQKPTLVDLLDKLKEKRMYPPHLPVDNRLGLLLHGPPGTGKSATILAAANRLGRDILMVDMKLIQTRQEMDMVFNPQQIDDRLYLDNTIIVLEEIDCIMDVICRRGTGSAGLAPGAESTNQKMAEKLLELSLTAKDDKERERFLNEYKKASRGEDTRVDLSYLLLKLDGLETAEDRCIIATTNHPELIDEALLRPGRFDYKLLLTYCTNKALVDILTMVFQLNATSRTEIEDMGLPGGVWTPAEVQAIAVIATSAISAATKLLTPHRVLSEQILSLPPVIQQKATLEPADEQNDWIDAAKN